MSIYGIGFILAAALYLYYAIRTYKSLKAHHFIVAIIAGLFSWLGVIIMIAMIKTEKWQ